MSEADDEERYSEEMSDQSVVDDIAGRPQQGGAIRRGLQVMPRIFPYLRPFKKFAALSVLLTVVLAVVALAEPWPLAFVVDSIIGDKSPPGWVTIFGTSTGALIGFAVAATLGLTLLSGGLEVINEYLSTTVDQRMVMNLRSDMFKHAQKLSLGFHDSASTGILMYRINNQASSMGQVVVALPALAQSVLTVFGMAYISFHINHLLALLALGTTPFVIYSTTYYTDRIEPRLYRVRGMGAMNLSIVYESMSMMRVVLAFGTQRREHARFRKQGDDWVDETVALTVRQTAFKLAVQTITSAGTAAVLGVGAYQAVTGKITAGELLVVLSYISQVYAPLEELATTIAHFQQWFIGLNMSFDLLDMKPDVKEKPDAVELENPRGEVELDRVGFGYTGRPGVLEDVSFRIPPGRAVGIVGPTGAGKSTLVSLIPRFYDAKEGRILIDGKDIRDLKLESLRGQFSIVLQEPLLFSETIAANIRYGTPDATTEDVVEAAKSANAHEFISELPEGYETMLGERGAKISGGERQRIAVARAFLRDSPILILDEPTSSIDSRTEAVILEALERLMQGRTTIMIAHRLSTIRAVDEILVLSDGELVQRGSHDELISQPGLYGELWAAQTGGEEAALAPELEPGTPEKAAGWPEVTSLPSRAEAELAPGEPATVPAAAPVAAGGPAPSPKPHDRREGRAAALPRPKIVLLGMLTKIPVGGAAWLVGQYAQGFERLGYEVYYVEAHARTPSMFMSDPDDDGTAKAASFIAEIAKRFGFEGRWAFQALHESDRTLGMSAEQLDRLYRDAALIINMHGGTLPLPEHAATDRLVYLGTDPVELELEIHEGDQRAIEFLDQHTAFFTWGLNFGNPDCKLPWASPYPFVPSPPPVILDFWDNEAEPSGPLSTIGNWRQSYRDVRFEGREYSWSKHQQFLKILDLPMRTQTPIELALASYEDEDHLLLAEHGWRVRPGYELSRDLDRYRDYIVASAGEVSAAKEQNVFFRSGWFSERSATYLAAGRPVIVQDTGFGAGLPAGEGLFAFDGVEAAAEAIEKVKAHPSRHRRAAREVAREYLSHEVVLGDMLDHVGLRPQRRAGGQLRPPAPARIPHGLSLKVRSRNPLELHPRTVERILARPVPAVTPPAGRAEASVVMPVLNNLACTRMALEGLLANTSGIPYEVIVVDNGSDDETRQYLEVLAARNRHVRVIRNDRNSGFAAACNQGLEAAAGDLLVLLNNDTIVPPGWLTGLAERSKDPAIGLAGPTTNRCGGPAQIPVVYDDYGQMLIFARERAEPWADRAPVDVAVAEMFCAAMRRDVFEEVGPLDERFEIGMFEDDDYAHRVREAGYRVVCVEELFVHHFGEASLGELTADGSYGQLFHANRRRFEEKWGVSWEPHGRREDPEYAALAERLEEAVRSNVPEESILLVVSRGDEALLALGGREAWHFPQDEDGSYAGHHPADDEEATAELERLRERGAEYLVLPATSLWWLDHYTGFRDHLERYELQSDDRETAMIYRLVERVGASGETRSGA